MDAKSRRSSLLFVAFMLVSVVSFIAGTRYEQIFAAIAPVVGIRTSTESIDLSSVQETYRQLVANYDGEIDTEKLIHGASRGLTEAVGDQYTMYMDPEESEEFEKSLNGDIGGGIGAEIGLRNNLPTIIRPLDGSPAKEAGINPGDVIVRVNSEEVSGWTVEKVVEKIRGEVGTSVKLTLSKGSEKREVSVVRQNIVSPAVESKIENGIGILKVNRFSDNTVSEAQQAASNFVNKGVDKVILDLRDNPGGTVNSAQGLLGLWLKNEVIMTERRGPKTVKTLKSTGTPILADVKTVVLINNNSASASEIVAGALRDYDKAKLVGQKSYGKGSVQVMITLSGGSRLKVTEARWYTPKGKNIDKSGITPDKVVDLTTDDVNAGRDPQMDEAKKL